MNTQEDRPVWLFLLFPGVAMLLGWGLRGYIGGGPFGAMIPGCLVALTLSLLLGHTPAMARMLAVFGTVGIGLGGTMTYGQTIGLAIGPETIGWGLLGLTLKGAIWGLLGGAVIGLGFTYRRYDQKVIVLGWILAIAAFYLGWKLINEPKLIYFSNPFDKPREESWAGLLCAGLALMAFFRIRGKNHGPDFPLHFALWGLLGGGLGFGGGGLWMAFGPSIPVDQRWFGWWKMMEFTFGLLLGISYGLCAWLNRDALKNEADRNSEADPEVWTPLLQMTAIAGLIAAAYFLLPMALFGVGRLIGEDAGLIGGGVVDLLRTLANIMTVGGVLLWVGLRWPALGWQIALTFVFFHAAFDLIQDFSGENGFEVSMALGITAMVLMTVAVSAATAALSSRENVTLRMFLLMTWSCYAVSIPKAILRREVLTPTAEAVEKHGGWLPNLLEATRTQIFVHAVFTLSAIAVTWMVLRYSQDTKAGD